MGLPPSPNIQSNSTNRRTQLGSALIRITIAIVVGILLSQISLDFIEGFLYDLRFRLRPNPSTSGKVELVQINPETVQDLKGIPGAKEHQIFLEQLLKSEPLAVFYDLDLGKVTGTMKEKSSLVETIKRINNFYVGTEEFALSGEKGKLRLPSPFEDINLITAPKSEDINNFAKDHISRRMLLKYQDLPILHIKLASLVRADAVDIENIRGRFEVLGTQQAYVDFHRQGSFPIHRFIDVYRGRLVSEKPLKGKIVIVGTDLQMNASDYVMTPYQRNVVAMTRSEMHANVIDTLIRNSSPIRISNWLNSVFVILISLFTIHVVLKARPMKGILILLATVVCFGLFGIICFWGGGILINMAHPLLTIFLSYYFFIPFRLIKENQLSWEYYQRNQLLSQVEELKSNFISMMSHDLKTPIARIQGMIAVILNDKTILSAAQREALDSIRNSSEDLLHFINAILQYGKIESQKVQLQLKNKDINELVQEVVKKYDFLAKTKRIRIETEIEPLFSIQMDPDLIRQVLGNLLENAIKYSPEDSKVWVKTEERDEKVVITFRDQGLGIPTEDLPNIFMKFFRSKNAKLSPIKGSGLGLYLAKYFIELHQGVIFVESTYGQGSTFTVELPLTQKRG